MIFQGQVAEINGTWVKNGEGVAMLSNGNVIIGNWQRDQLKGEAMIFPAMGGKYTANFEDGMLNGWSILNFYGKTILATKFYEDKVDDDKFIYEENQKLWMSTKYTEKNKLYRITHVEEGSKDCFPSFMDNEPLEKEYD